MIVWIQSLQVLQVNFTLNARGESARLVEGCTICLANKIYKASLHQEVITTFVKGLNRRYLFSSNDYLAWRPIQGCASRVWLHQVSISVNWCFLLLLSMQTIPSEEQASGSRFQQFGIPEHTIDIVSSCRLVNSLTWIWTPYSLTLQDCVGLMGWSLHQCHLRRIIIALWISVKNLMQPMCLSSTAHSALQISWEIPIQQPEAMLMNVTCSFSAYTDDYRLFRHKLCRLECHCHFK